MLDNQFDPYDAIITLDQNVQALITAHNNLADRVREQGEVIDVLIKGLDAANKANMRLMEQGIENISRQFTSTGQH